MLGAAAVLLALATLVVYSRAGDLQFLAYDDDQYVTANPWVRGGLTFAGLRWAFTTLAVANWHPLTWLSHMLDIQLFGLNAGAHHLMNAGFHAANAALLFAVLTRMTGAPWRSAVVAALFAVHPLHVESVAWVSERKDVLSTFFGFVMLWAYGRYAERPAVLRYAAVAGAFALSLLCKPMWVTAPFLLLLLDFWPLGRVDGFRGGIGLPPPSSRPKLLGRLALEKLPLLVLSALSAAATLVAQRRGGALIPMEAVGFLPRLANAILSYAAYVGKTLWPVSLAPLYPFPPGGAPAWRVVCASGLIAAATWATLTVARRRPWLPVGWLWYLGTLVPVIGLVQVGSQAMADRYTYVPLVGLFTALAWEIGERTERLSGWARSAVFSAVAVVLIFFSVLTSRQIGYWSDQVTLFRQTLAVTADNGRAHLILSQALAERGNYGEALAEGREAVRLDPYNPRAHKNLGFVLYRLGRVDEAIASFQRAVVLKPDYAEAHGNLGIAYGKKGWIEAAVREMSLEAALTARGP